MLLSYDTNCIEYNDIQTSNTESYRWSRTGEMYGRPLPICGTCEDKGLLAQEQVVSLKAQVSRLEGELRALASLAVVLADARPAALLAPASLAVVLGDARPGALLPLASSVEMEMT